MNLDWRRLRAVVLESDDWGLCAWSPDEQAHRVLAGTPAFRTAAGAIYGRSTLESAADVGALHRLLVEFRGADGFPPVWQANTVMAAPDYERLEPPLFPVESIPLVLAPEAPARWRRPGLWQAVADAVEAGVWWPELHGLHHLPAHAWLAALRRGEDDARRAHGQQSPICRAVEASGEYDTSEPAVGRSAGLELAVSTFTRLFGRAPQSLCPPDYRWDARLEDDAERLGVTTFQGRAERVRRALPRLRRVLHRYRWPHREGRRFYLPPRIAFEPRGQARAGRFGVASTLRAARAAWGRGQPAIVSTHRVNYAHLDAAWSAAGREALHALLEAFVQDGAVFLTDAEVRQLVDRSWSVRPIGVRGVLLRHHGVPGEAVRFPAPAMARGVVFADGANPPASSLAIVEGHVEARVNLGEHLLQWTAA